MAAMSGVTIVKKGVYIVAGKRTPFGKFGGMFREVGADELFAAAARAALRAGGVHPALIDTVNIGQISPLSESGLSPRHAALKAGIPQEKPVLALNKMSASALEAIYMSVQEIVIGSANISLAGGMENLSSVPFLARNVRSGINFGSSVVLEDFLSSSNYDYHSQKTLIQLSDYLAEKCNLTRTECDEFAFRSQQRWKLAHDHNIFDAELAPVTLKIKDRVVTRSHDEHPRPDITMEFMSKMPPVYKGGVSTPANCCGINDGAGALILTSEDSLHQHDLTPLSRVVAWANAGSESIEMGTALVLATQKLLDAVGLTIDDVDLVEIHETFASQALTCARLLQVDPDKLNVNGGALAMGHPSGASGARIISHLSHELRRKNLRRGLASIWIADGQGTALLVENIESTFK